MRKYPILVAGFGIKRWERRSDDAQIENGAITKEEYWDKAGLMFMVDRSSQMWGPSSIQYKSKFGFLIMWPLCFHIWFQFKPQATKPDTGETIPGSEIVFYWRVGMWRWDANMSQYIGPGTWYGPGLHFD